MIVELGNLALLVFAILVYITFWAVLAKFFGWLFVPKKQLAETVVEKPVVFTGDGKDLDEMQRRINAFKRKYDT